MAVSKSMTVKISRGYVALLSTICISIVLLEMAITQGVQQYLALRASSDTEDALKADQLALGCVQALSLLLKQDSDYRPAGSEDPIWITPDTYCSLRISDTAEELRIEAMVNNSRSEYSLRLSLVGTTSLRKI